MKFGLLACVLSIGQAVPQGDSIVDAARRQGGAVTIDLHVMPTVGTVEELANVSSLILRGKVVSLATRLSKDETIVVTEYEIAPQRPSFRTNRPRVSSARDGCAQDLPASAARAHAAVHPTSSSSLDSDRWCAGAFSPHSAAPDESRPWSSS